MTHHDNSSHIKTLPRPEQKGEPKSGPKKGPALVTPMLVTHGCRLNGYESEVMRNLGGEANIGESVIINSCAVTNEAVRQTRQSIRRARKDNPSAKIIVTGCAAQLDAPSFGAMPEVDAVLGNQEKLKPESWTLLASRFQSGESLRQAATRDIAPPEEHDPHAIMLVNDIMSVRETAPHLIDGYGDRARAFLQIQNGCDHRCTFCIIPFGRGNSRSVPVAAVVEQAKRLVDSGHKEIVLTGVDITSYGPDLEDAPSLGNLVSTLLEQVPDLFRLRLSSIDGAEIDDELFARITEDERIAPYLHLSLQAGDDMILKRMKRRHTRAQAIELCDRIREIRPGTAFGADIIAGFPTETQAMFENSLKMIKEADLQFVHVFPYSARVGTPAEKMPQLNGQIIKQRAAALRAEAQSSLHKFLDGLVGQRFDGVCESGGRARLGNFAQVKLDKVKLNQTTIDDPGAIVSLMITGREGDVLTAS